MEELAEEKHEITSELLDEAIRFHGHLGPFLVLGLKAGLYANDALGKDCFRIRVLVETKLSPPYSCLIDGIQIATGCTMGKRNIEARDGNPISIKFTRDDRVLEMRLREEVLEYLKDMRTEEDARQKALEIMRKPINELFDFNATGL